MNNTQKMVNASSAPATRNSTNTSIRASSFDCSNSNTRTFKTKKREEATGAMTQAHRALSLAPGAAASVVALVASRRRSQEVTEGDRKQQQLGNACAT